MRIYTRTGDRGTTSVCGGLRISKDSARIEACGDVDEFNTTVGLVRTLLDDPELDEKLAWIQSDLFVLGADLSTPQVPGKAVSARVPRVQAEDVMRLERWIDEADAELEPLRTFLVPGGTPAAAHLHFARAVCRRAERRAVRLASQETINLQVCIYLNRLSDLLFMWARLLNQRAGVEETLRSPRQTHSPTGSARCAA